MGEHKSSPKETLHIDSHAGEDGGGPEPQRAIIAVHPSRLVLAIAVGDELRVYDASDGEVHTLISSGSVAEQSIVTRALAFSRCGRFLATGGDDKMTRLWSCEGWKCLKTFKSPKKISVVGFSADSSVFLGGNKFGDVLVATTAEEEGAIAVETLLGHYCSILTSLRLSEDGRLLATTDRDSKIRVSLMPKNPMLGAHEIQTYCFGHTSFVQCGSFVPGPGTPKLVTGGGDGTVRLWNAEEGALLCTLEIPASGAEDGSAEEHGGARHVLALACSQDGRHAVVIMDRDPSLRVLAVDAAAGKVEMGAICTLPGLPIVSDVVCDFEGRFWLVGGPLDGEATAAIVVCAQLSPEGQLTVCEPEPLGAEAKEKLQQCASAPADVKPSSFLPSYLAKKRKWEDAEKRHAERAGKPDS